MPFKFLLTINFANGSISNIEWFNKFLCIYDIYNVLLHLF
jgi:hypothetical protein